jgi:hypothetical protein
MRLTQLECKNAKPSDKPYKLVDGAGLFLLVNSNGAKYWRLAYRFHGKQKTLALGVYPSIGLAEARKAAADAKEMLQRSLDPGVDHIKKRLELRQRGSSGTRLTGRVGGGIGEADPAGGNAGGIVSTDAAASQDR